MTYLLRNMGVKALTLFALLSHFNFTHSAHVSGIITENVTFFYRKLAVAPSIRATIEFKISYSQRSMRGERPVPLMGIYTQYPIINIAKQCSYNQYGQLRNENLHPLKLGGYGKTMCELSGSDTVNCRGRVSVQNFIPSNFYLTFGFDCRWPRIHSPPGPTYNGLSMNSLKGMKYDISFSNQSNETNECVDFSTKLNTKVCNEFYHHTSLPNLIGDEQLDQIRDYSMLIQLYDVATLSHGRCHQHLLEILCHVMLPECDPVTQQVIHPCRETCWAILDACWQTWLSLGGNLARKYGRKWDENQSYRSKEIDCDLLPSLNGSVPCFYNPVTCDSPPDVTNSTVMVNASQQDGYQLHDVVQYACLIKTFEMRGTWYITCLYSGSWSHSPPRCVPVNIYGIKLVYFVFPVIFVILLVLFIIITIKYKRKSSLKLEEEKIELDNTLAQLIESDEPLLYSKRKQESTLSLDSPQLLKRNREFDDFVVYHFDTDHDFVVNTLIPHLEELQISN